MFIKDNSINVSKIEKLEEFQNYSKTEIKELQIEEDAKSSNAKERKEYSFSLDKDKDRLDNNTLN